MMIEYDGRCSQCRKKMCFWIVEWYFSNAWVYVEIFLKSLKNCDVSFVPVCILIIINGMMIIVNYWISCRLLEEDLSMVGYKAPKFIVYKECLSELLKCCPVCGLSCAVTWRVIGTFVAVTRHCSRCTYSSKWCSQPMVKDIPVGNLHLSAAMYFSGASFSKMQRVFAAFRLQFISNSTFYRHVQQLLQPTILFMWNVANPPLMLRVF